MSSKVSISLYEKNIGLFQERFPQLFFLYQFSQEKSWQYIGGDCPNAKDPSGELLFDPKEQKLINEKLSQVIEKKPPKVFYQIGIGLGDEFESIKNHLLKSSSFVVIEDDFSMLDVFLRSALATEALLDSRFVIKWILDKDRLDLAVDESIRSHPSEDIFINTTSYYTKHRSRYVEKLQELIRSKNVIHASFYQEDTYLHLLTKNFLRNYAHLKSSFYGGDLKGKFKNIPAVICGAGPSLNDAVSILKESQEKALIFAGGSTISALSNASVIPHLGFALDPNDDEYSRLKPSLAQEMPLLFGTRLLPDVMAMLSGPTGYIKTSSGGLVEHFLEEALGIDDKCIQDGMSQDGLSVTVICLAAAVLFGCNPIFLTGIDLAYVDGKLYADGVVQDNDADLEKSSSRKLSDQVFKGKNVLGEEVYSQVKWLMEARCIADYASKHTDVQIISCLEKGLEIEGLENMTLQEGIETHCTSTRDLRALVHGAIQSCRDLSKSKTSIDNFVITLQESFSVCVKLLEKLCQNREDLTSKEEILLELLEMDLHEEKSFLYFLKPFAEKNLTSTGASAEQIYKSLHEKALYYLNLFESHRHLFENT